MSSWLGHLGEVVFEVLRTPRELTRVLESVYAEHELAGAKSLAEWTGEKLHRVTFPVRLQRLAGVCEPEADLRLLYRLFESRQPAPLFLGETYLGDYVLTKIEEVRKRVAKDGALVFVDLKIHLLEYH